MATSPAPSPLSSLCPFGPLVLSLSLDRPRLTQFFLRQPEVDPTTKLWASCYLQLSHVVHDVLRDAKLANDTWSTLWAACAIGRPESVRAILASLSDREVRQPPEIISV